ncbi:MAG: hypothetical protein ACI8WB_000978 [Phenylobacterium sp.]|jgi:hypothetical protein
MTLKTNKPMWVNLLEDDKAVRAIYDEIPSLKEALLHDVTIKNYGPSIEIRFDLNEYPKNPPKKWMVSKCNTVQVVIELWKPTSLIIDGLFCESTVDLTMSSNNGGITLQIDGEFTFSCNAELVDLKKISAYQNQK